MTASVIDDADAHVVENLATHVRGSILCYILCKFYSPWDFEGRLWRGQRGFKPETWKGIF